MLIMCAKYSPEQRVVHILMGKVALTRASALGPLLDLVDAGGGSAERIFQMAEIPLRLCDNPDALIPLRDQFKIVELAAKELGDETLPVRLSSLAGVAGLGEYGRIFLSAPTVGAAITRGNRIYSSVLQSGTEMTLSVKDKTALWTYQVTDRAHVGRQKNEILAIGYMVDLLRRFLGNDWVPARVDLPGPKPDGRIVIETQYRCEFSGGSVVAMHFPAEMLEVPNLHTHRVTEFDSSGNVPDPADLNGCVTELVRLGLLNNRPQRDWVARRLGLSVRTLQRRLNDNGTNFAHIVQRVMAQQASEMLRCRDMPVSDIAYELGYSDPSHFSRAFTQWFSESPKTWRARNGCASS